MILFFFFFQCLPFFQVFQHFFHGFFLFFFCNLFCQGNGLYQIADQNGLKDPVYVGDTMGDFEACRKAGVPFVLAEYGFGEVPEPDMRISKPMDLITLFC